MVETRQVTSPAGLSLAGSLWRLWKSTGMAGKKSRELEIWDTNWRSAATAQRRAPTLLRKSQLNSSHCGHFIAIAQTAVMPHLSHCWGGRPKKEVCGVHTFYY